MMRAQIICGMCYNFMRSVQGKPSTRINHQLCLAETPKLQQKKVSWKFLTYPPKLAVSAILACRFMLASPRGKLLSISRIGCGKGSKARRRSSSPKPARKYWSKPLHKQFQLMLCHALILPRCCVMTLAKWLTGFGGLIKIKRIKFIGSPGTHYAAEGIRGVWVIMISISSTWQCWQAWRIVMNPDSLCARLLMAKYCPDGDLMKVREGPGTSYSWWSIVRGIQALKESIIWRMGNG